MKKSDRLAKQKHEKWLKGQGLHISQLEKRTKNLNEIPSYKVVGTNLTGNNIPTWEPNTYKKTVIENLMNESAETQAGILDKMTRIQPAFNKGGLQLIAKKDLKSAGKKYVLE